MLNKIMNKLYRKKKSMIPAEDQSIIAAMYDFFKLNITDESEIQRLSFDKIRFARTMEWLSELPMEGKEILELGGYSLASHVLKSKFPNNRYTYSNFDLREKFPYKDNSFDIVISMEVTEHICDINYTHGTTLSGVKQALAESFRVLKPGGYMFLSTPNSHSNWIIQRALLQDPPMLCPFHFREFTFNEMKQLIKDANFKIMRAETEQVWHFWNFDPIIEFMNKNGYNTDNRGDDIFILSKK